MNTCLVVEGFRVEMFRFQPLISLITKSHIFYFSLSNGLSVFSFSAQRNEIAEVYAKNISAINSFSPQPWFVSSRNTFDYPKACSTSYWVMMW
jgi:hypothetical protein